MRTSALVRKRGISISERVLTPKEWVLEPKKPAEPGTRAADDFRTIKARLDEISRERDRVSDKQEPEFMTSDSILGLYLLVKRRVKGR